MLALVRGDLARLQWGHGLAAVDGFDARDEERRYSGLQWGHGLAAVDGDEAVAVARVAAWLQWGHGLAAVDGLTSCPCMCLIVGFNGATALRPWTARQRRGRPRSSPSFNGATALRPWTAPPAGAGRARCHASMGPRPCGRGRGAKDLRLVVLFGLQWGHGLAAVDGGKRTIVEAAPAGLQWGHGLAAVDGRKRWRHARAGYAASMGPRPCGRGRLVPDYVVAANPTASMGPRPCGRGRGPCRAALSQASLASMGPRPCGRGRRRRRSRRLIS